MNGKSVSLNFRSTSTNAKSTHELPGMAKPLLLCGGNILGCLYQEKKLYAFVRRSLANCTDPAPRLGLMGGLLFQGKHAFTPASYQARAGRLDADDLGAGGRRDRCGGGVQHGQLVTCTFR